jgi:hypothetical protein
MTFSFVKNTSKRDSEEIKSIVELERANITPANNIIIPNIENITVSPVIDFNVVPNKKRGRPRTKLPKENIKKRKSLTEKEFDEVKIRLETKKYSVKELSKIYNVYENTIRNVKFLDKPLPKRGRCKYQKVLIMYVCTYICTFFFTNN